MEAQTPLHPTKRRMYISNATWKKIEAHTLTCTTQRILFDPYKAKYVQCDVIAAKLYPKPGHSSHHALLGHGLRGRGKRKPGLAH